MVTQQEAAHQDSNLAHLLPRSISKPLWCLVPFSFASLLSYILFTPPGRASLLRFYLPLAHNGFSVYWLHAWLFISIFLSLCTCLPARWGTPKAILFPFVTHCSPRTELAQALNLFVGMFTGAGVSQVALVGMCKSWVIWLTSLFQSMLTLTSVASCHPVSTPAC